MSVIYGLAILIPGIYSTEMLTHTHKDMSENVS